MRIKPTVERQKKFEGFSPTAYKCSRGVYTIGYGNTSWHGHPVSARTPIVTKQEAEIALKASILDAITDCHTIYPNWRELSHVQQEVLVHMAYQLGGRGLRKFKQMNKAVAVQDLKSWAAEMQDSLWWDQTPRAAYVLHEAIRTGEFPQGRW